MNSPGINTFRIQIDNSMAFDTNSSSFRSTTIQNNEFPNSSIMWAVARLDFNQTYYWRVQGINNSGISAWSEVRSFTTLDKVTLTGPSDGSTNVESPVELTWTEVTGAEYYQIQLDTNPSFTKPTVYQQATDTSNYLNYYINTFGKVIHWRVRALHVKDTSAYSDAFSFIANPVGIEEEKGMRFSVVPNPADNIINIRYQSDKRGALRIGFYNTLGSLVREEVVTESSKTDNIQLDVSRMNSGVYILMLDQNGTRRSQRLIIR